MLRTVPVSRDLVCAPLHRIYGHQRLPRLLERYSVHEEQYARRDPGAAAWVERDKDEALRTQGSEGFYALGLFVLGRADA
jgi:hypothetical protein